jgi:hypothetical protein
MLIFTAFLYSETKHLNWTQGSIKCSTSEVGIQRTNFIKY